MLCYIISGGNTESGNSTHGFDGIWVLFRVYIMVVNPFVWIASVTLGIKGLKTKERIYSYITLALMLLSIIIVVNEVNW